jgi:5'-deoxy-5'-methylthioadenosine phosphorylase
MVMLTAIIGGSGLSRHADLENARSETVSTPYGEPSGPLLFGRLEGRDVVFLGRHGVGHTIPPHRVNYRANIHALHQAGAGQVLAVNAVGAISQQLAVADLVIPHQLIDYTYGRAQTFFDDIGQPVTHVDFSEPFSRELRDAILATAKQHAIAVHGSGTYAATQGPRFETAAEIERLARDGATIVGMTGMPEAALAREMELRYAMVAVIANPAAGRAAEPLSQDEVMRNLVAGIDSAWQLLLRVLPAL